MTYVEKSIRNEMKWKPYIQAEQYYWQISLGTRNNASYIIKIYPSTRKRRRKGKENNNNQVTTIINIIKQKKKLKKKLKKLIQDLGFQLDLKLGLGSLVSHLKGDLFLFTLKRLLRR